MLATGHAVSGLLAGTATSGVVAAGPAEPVYWAWALTVCGAALLPDLDAKGTTVDRLWGPLTGGLRVRLLGRKRTVVPGLWSLVRPLVGGHRRGTHATVGLLVLLAVVWTAGHWVAGTAAVVALATGLALRGAAVVAEYLLPFRYRRGYWVGNLAASAAAAWASYERGLHLPAWVPFALAGGALVHVLGDLVTDGKVHLDWPFNDRPVGLPKALAFRVGGWVELAIVTPLLTIAAGLVVAYDLGYDPVGAVLTAMRGL